MQDPQGFRPEQEPARSSRWEQQVCRDPQTRKLYLIIRLGFTKAVVSSFGTLMAAHRGEVVCVVTTAKVSTSKSKLICFNILLSGARRCKQEGSGGRPGGFPQVRREGSHLLRCWRYYCRWHGGKLENIWIAGLLTMSWEYLFPSWFHFSQVSIADKFVDMSMASKLTKYSELIKGAA